MKMATVLYHDGTRKRVEPINKENFTLEEISNIVGGLVQPMFFKKKWLFVSKTGYIQGLPHNQYAELVIGYPVFGPMFIAGPDDLSKEFFVPNNDMYSGSMAGNGPDFTKSSIQEKEEEEKIEKMIIFFNETFGDGKDFNEINKNFIIQRDGKLENLSYKIDKQMEYLVDVMDKFCDIEEYEKCSIIRDYIDSFSKRTVNKLF